MNVMEELVIQELFQAVYNFTSDQSQRIFPCGLLILKHQSYDTEEILLVLQPQIQVTNK